MKRLLFFLVTLVSLSPVFSQTKLTNSADTILQSTTAYSTSAKQPNLFEVVTIQANFLKVSGAPSFYAIPQGSLDGTYFVDISKDTAKGTNVTPMQPFAWAFDKRKYLFYRVATTTNATTQAIKQTVSILGTPPAGK